MNLLTILKQKIILNDFGQFVSHVSPIISPYFSIFLHAKGDVDIILFKINKILLDNRKVINIFNNYFQSVTKNLDLFEWPDERKFNIFYEIDKFWSQKLFLKKRFVFKLVTKQLVEDIPLNLLKESTFALPYFVRCINEALVKSKITDPLKLSNLVPVHKKSILLIKPTTDLLVYYRYQKVMYEQLCEYLNNYLNHLLCGFIRPIQTSMLCLD